MQLRYLLLATILLGGTFLAGSVQAQDESEDFSIERWRGGTFNARMHLGMNLMGSGMGTGMMGGVLSHRVFNGATSLFANPAELAHLQARQIALGSRLGLGTQAFGGIGGSAFSSDIQQETDAFLGELGFSGQKTPAYTQVAGISARQKGQISTLALSVPVHDQLVLGIGSTDPLNVSFETRLTGLEAMLDASQSSGGQTIGIGLLAQANIMARFQMQVYGFGIGAGSRLFEGPAGSLGIGASATRYSASNVIAFDFQPRGVINLGGSQEYYFNDPNDPNLVKGETNKLLWRGTGNYNGSAWGVRTGLYYEFPFSWLSVSALYNHLPDISLKDPEAYTERYLPVFINLGGSSADTAQTFDISKLSLAKPNLTAKDSDSLGQAVMLSLPSSFTLGMDLGMGPHTLALNYTRYSGDLSYKLTYGKSYTLGKQPTHGFRSGLDFAFPDRLRGWNYTLIPVRLLFLDIDGLLMQAFRKYTGYKDPHYRLGGGVMFGPAVTKGFAEDSSIRDMLGMPMPTGFALSRQYTVFDELDVGVMLVGIPDLAFRLSLAYTFD